MEMAKVIVNSVTTFIPAAAAGRTTFDQRLTALT
jgi:hypothetical protein